MDDIDGTALMELDRKLARACQIDRGVTLTAAEVNAFVAVGGLKIVSDAAQAMLIDLARRRSGRTISEPGPAARAPEPIVAARVPAAPPSRSQLNEVEHRIAERRAIEAAQAIRRKGRLQPASLAKPAP